MSHPLYNPYASGNQSSTQGQYGLSSIQDERDPRMASSQLGPGSSFSSSGASSVTPANSGEMLPSLLPQSMSYRSEQSRSVIDENIETSIDMHISRAREGLRSLGKPMHQPIDQGTRFTSTQRDEFLSSGTGMASYSMSSTSASLGHRHSGVESGSSSLDWSSNYKGSTADDPPRFYSSSASSNYASGGDGRFKASSEREHDMQSIPGLGDKPVAPTDSSQPKYTSESASSILLHFGLEKEDLEHLLCYPEDQLTPANLPFILRQIRIEKTKRATTAVQSKPCPEPQPTRISGMDSHSLSSSGGLRMHQEEMSSSVLQPSKVIDYGHTGKYTGGVREEIGRTVGSRANTGGSMLLMDTYDSSRHNREPLQKTTTEVKSSALGSSRDQGSSVSSLSSSYSSILSSVAPPSNDQTKQMQTQPNQTFQSILSSFFSLPTKDTDIRALKSEASKPVPLKEPDADRQSTSKIQPPSTLCRDVHPSRPGLLRTSRIDASGTTDESKIPGQGSIVAEQMNKQQTHQQPIQQKLPTQMQAVSQMGQTMWPPVSSAVRSIPPASHIPSITGAMQRPGGPRPIVIPPALPKPIPNLMNLVHPMLPPSKRQPPAKVAVSKGLPTAAMMHDYAAATPRIFPHTCCLCNKECTRMKDWISHQNSSLHLESCRLLRKQYPEWDGEIALRPSAPGKGAKPSPSTASQSSQHRQKARHGSNSRSPSPRHHGSEGRREKRNSQSHSPHSSKYTCRSRSRSHSPWYDRPTSSCYRSRSRSAERRSSPRWRDDRRSSPRRRDDRRSSPSWSRERLSSPSWSDERRSLSRRSDERRSPPRRSDERRSPPRRSDQRRSSPRRSDERLSPPRRSDQRRSPPRRSDERLSQLRRSNERLSPPRRSNLRLSPTRRSDQRLSPPRRSDQRLSPPRRSDQRLSPPRRSDQRRLPPRRSDQLRSPQRKKSSSAESLVKKLLKTSGVQSLSEQSDLEAVAKTLVPAFLAELAKMKSSSSSSSSSIGGNPFLSSTASSSSFSSTAKKKELTKKPSKAKPSLQKSKGRASTKTKETVSTEQKKPPHKKPATSSVSTPQTTTTRKVLLPRPKMPPLKGPKETSSLPSRAKKATTGKLTNQKSAAKSSVTGPTTVTKAKVLVSKAKNVSTKQKTKTLKKQKLPAKGAEGKAVGKQKGSSGSKSTAPENQPDVENSKPKKSETKVQEAVPKHTAKVVEKANVTVFEPKHQAELDKTNDAEDAEPMEVGEMGVEVAEPMGVGSCAEGQGEKLTTTEAVPENSADKSSESQPPKSTVDTRPTETSVKALPHVQPSTLTESESPAQGLETKTPKGSVTGPTAITKAKVLVSKAKNVSTKQVTKMVKNEKLPAKEAVRKAVVKQKTSSGSKSTAPENQPDVENSKPKESETKVQEAVPKHTAKVVEKANVTVFEPKHQAELDKTNDAKDAEPMEVGEMVAEVAEPMGVGSCAEGQGEKLTTTEAVPENSADKSSESQPPKSTVDTRPTETSVKALPHVQPSTLSESESPAQGLETKTPKGSVTGPTAITKAKVLVSNAKNVSTKQVTKMVKNEKLPAKEAVRKAVVKQKTSSGSKSTAPENQPDVENSKPKESETKVQGAVPKHTAKVVEKANVTVFEPKHQAELDKTNDAKDAEPMEVGEMVAEVAEPMGVGSCAEGQGEKPTTTEAVPENSADKSSESQPPKSTVDTRPTETSVKALPHVQQSTLSEPESTAQGLETKTEASHMQQQAAGSSTETTVEAKMPGGGVETKTMQKDPVTAVKTQMDSASSNDASKPSAVTSLTVGEMVEKHLHQSRIRCLIRNSSSFHQMKQCQKHLLITNLPVCYDGYYTEDDLAKLLRPFGFQYTDDSIYVVPQTRMAFVLMPTVENMKKILDRQGIQFKRFELGFHAVTGIRMTPLGFYKSLMELMCSPVVDNGQSIVFIKNISWSETRELREALKKISCVKNFLPLLNKVFIEFESIHDADRLGVWYSLLKQAPGHKVNRLIVPYIDHTLRPPKLPENALPDSKDAVAGATVPPMEFGIPQGSIGPSWVTMRIRPFLYPTVSPWFIIPDYLTVRGLDDIEKASSRGSMFPTIMLTGLPGGGYKHEDVAKLVWRYFPKQNLHSLYYNVTVLTLQRRAFVFFADWTTCCDFVRDHITNPVSVKGCTLSVHFVLEHMCPESSEEMMYTTLMRLSNAGVPEPKSLEERLLCVEISEASLGVIRVVMEMVASIVTFVSFLPLANRICIEMADSSGVTKVVKKYNTFSSDYLKKAAAWNKVQRVEPLKSLKQRLQDSNEITIIFGPDTINLKAKPPAVKCQTQPPVSQLSDNGSQPALQTSGPGGSTISEPITAGPSATAASDVAMKEDGEKPGTVIIMDSTVGPDANEDEEKAEVREEEGSLTTLSSTADVTSTCAVSSGNTVPAASSPAPSATALTPEENFAELPQINTAIFQALKAAVHNHRLIRESTSQSGNKKAPSKSNKSSRTAPQRKCHNDFADDNVSSAFALLFDDVGDRRPGPHSSSDPVTAVKTQTDGASAKDASKPSAVKHLFDDVGDRKPEPHSSSSSKRSSSMKRKRQSSDPVTAVKTQTDGASAKDASECKTVKRLTIGEMVEKHLDPSRIGCLTLENCLSPTFPKHRKKQMLITNLPEYYDGCYTEDDLAKLLMPFGFQYTEDRIHVVPQTRIAFVVMPTGEDVVKIIKGSVRSGIIFKGSKLGFHVCLSNSIAMTPLEFYKSLMKLMRSPVDNEQSIVVIKNISWSETKELREALKKINCVKNFLPLLNKVFIGFESFHDADRLGVWYSLLKQAPDHEVHRLNVPYIGHTLRPPRLPENALPDSKDAVVGATVPPMQFGIPQGSIGPSWVTMRTRPFLFPTVSPWFIIPDYLTVRGLDDIEKASGRGSMFSTIMLTGLPVGNCKHEDVAKLVWRYFPKQDLHSLYYNVTVLTLQRRAFVFFADWTACCDFVRDHISNPVSVKGCELSVHFVLEHLRLKSSEEMMYTTLMKLSNAGVPESKSLEERLLCVEISEASLDVIRVVMEMVASIVTFVSFLPLANRICIEMADSSGVNKVVEKHNTFSPDSAKKREAWSKVQRVEPVKSLKQRLQDSSEITINFAEPPQVNKAIFQVLKAAVHNHRLTRESTSQSENKEAPSKSNKSSRTAPQRKCHNDFADDNVSSDFILLFDDVGDRRPGPHSSSSSKRRQSSDPVTAVKTQTDGASAKDASKPSAVTHLFDDGGDRKPKRHRSSSSRARRKRQSSDPVTAVKTQTDGASDKDASECKTVKSLTIGEMVEKHLDPSRIGCLKLENRYSRKFVQLLITNLPEYYDGCYTEDDLVELLMPFGFKYMDYNIYVVPQMRMAFVVMPTLENMFNILNLRKGIIFKGFKLHFRRVAGHIEMRPLGFYKSLMTRMRSPVVDDGQSIVVIKNISWSENRELREALKKISCVKNFLPLLNKVFIEFESVSDADRLGIWYSLLKQAPDHEVHRLKTADINHTLLSPRLPENALPDSKDAVAGATIPPMEFGIPQGSIGPSWVTMRTRPFLFPTVSPWFIIPDYLTVRGLDDIEKASGRGSMFPTIMLTGLPEGGYKHEDVAKLVWRYFPKQDLHSLYYNVTILPLQRRAFVFFADWTACCDFVRDHITNPVSVEGFTLSVHFVLEHMCPESSEEMMYTTLMRLSNAGVPEPKSLEERLLCVEISEASLYIIREVMEVVESVATFVSFLPLANRICIEMADSSGVTKVVEKYNTFSPDFFKKRVVWRKVQRVEPLKRLKLRLQHSNEIPINFEPDTIKVKAKSPAVKYQTQPPPSELSDNGSQPALQTSGPGGSTISELITAGPNATATSDIAMKEDGEKPGTEITMDSTVGPEANEDVEKAKVKGKEGSLTTLSSTAAVPAAYSPAPSATALMPEKNFAGLPQINTDIFQALKAAVRNYRLTRESTSQSEDKEGPSKSNTSSRPSIVEDAPQRKGQDDFTDDIASSDDCLFDEQNFNMDDFVTIDEVGDDVGDTSPERHRSSSSKHSSRARRERQSPGVSFAGKRTSTRSLKDSKSSSSSSKSNKGSTFSSCVSQKKSKNSSEPTKSPTKPSASAIVSKASYSSSPLTTKTPSSPDPKNRGSKTKSPAKASNTASSGCSTHSSSTARETERITSATTVKASVETHSEPLREEAKSTERAVAKSDHKVSAEGIAAKTIESVTKIETSSEMHPPLQGHGVQLSQASSLAIHFNVNTLKDQKKSKEEGKEDDVDKHTDDNGEKYQILDSFDQMDEPMDVGNQDGSSEAQLTEPKGGQTLHVETFQVLDSVDDEGKARPEEYNRMEMDVFFQVMDSVTEDQSATGQEDSHLAQDDSSTVKQLSEADKISAGDKSDKDSVGKDHETNNIDNFQSLDTGSKQAPRDDGDGKKRNEEGVRDKILSAASCKASKDVENPDIQIPNDDQPPQDPNNKETLKDPDSDVTEQETFEILDSIEDQTATVNDSLEPPSDQISKEDIRPLEEEEDTYQVIDSVEDQPTALETESEFCNKGKRNTRGETTARKDDRPSKRSGPTTRVSKSEEMEKSPEKRNRTVKKYETRTKVDTTAGISKIDKEVTEDILYEIVDSVEDESAQDAATKERSGRRRSARGRKEDKMTLDVIETSEKPEEATYKILDSVEDETANDEPTITTRSTRGKRERTTKKDASNEKIKKEDMPTRRRHTPARESQEQNREKTPKKEDKAPPKESTPSKKSDNVIREVSEEDATCEVFDSVEDEVLKDDRPATRRKGKRGRPKKAVKTTKKESATLKEDDKDASEKEADEEEATYQILDSVEDDTVDDLPPTGQSKKKNTKNNDQQTKDSGSLAGSPKNEEEEEEEPMYQIIDSLEDDQAQEELTATEEKTKDETKEEASAEKGDTQTCKLRKRQAAANEKQYAKVQEARRTRGREQRERRSRSSSRGGGGGGGMRWVKERGREKEETVEVDPKEMVTLDEVGADEAGEERATESREWDGEITEGELQTLVTLDEFVEEEEDGKAEQITLETRPPSQEDESVDFLNPETLVTLDEAGDDEEEKPHEEQAEKTSRSAKRKQDDDTEESMDFVTVDEVGEEEEKEAVKIRTRGRAKKNTRQTLVVSKRRREPVGREAKRSRSQSPGVAADVKLAFRHNNPLSQESVVSKLGYFCNLCSVFCQNESTAKELHCSSQGHLDNLQKQNQKPSRSSTQSSQGSVSD